MRSEYDFASMGDGVRGKYARARTADGILKELFAAVTNLLASAFAFSLSWRLFRGALSWEGLIDLGLTVFLYLPLVFLLGYAIWRVGFRLLAPRATMRASDLWLPGLILGACIGALASTTRLLDLFTPVIRRVWE